MYRCLKAGLNFAVVVIVGSYFSPSVLAMEFVISNATVSSDNIIAVDIAMNEVSVINCPSGKCYLQGFLSKKEASKYFGFTENTKGDWIAYQPKPEKAFIVNNYLACEIVEAACHVVGRMKFNHDDPKYEGPGEYEVKFARYTGESDNKAGEYTNALTINLAVATPASTQTPTSGPTYTPTPVPIETPIPTNTPTSRPTRTPTPKPSPNPTMRATKNPEVMGLNKEFIDPVISPTPQVAADAGIRMPIIAGALVFGGIGFLSAAGYPILKRYKATRADKL